MRAAIACVCLFGCGRVGFDPLGDATGSTGDSDSVVAPACNPFDIELPTDIPYANPNAVWTGNRWFVYFVRTAGVAALPVDSDGTVGAPQDIAPNSELAVATQGLAWDGSRLALLTINGANSILLRLWDPVSGVLSGPITINPVNAASGQHAMIAWAGDRYVVAWSNGVNVYLREVDRQGGALTAELLISSVAGNAYSVASNATHHVVCGDFPGLTYAVSVDRTSFVGQTMSLDLGGGSICHVLAGADGTFAATFESTNVSNKLHQLDSAAMKKPTGTTLAFLTDSYQRLAFTPTGYRVVGFKTTAPLTIQSFELDSSAALVSGPTTLDTFTATAWYWPALVTTDERALYTVAIDGSARLKLLQTCP